MRSHDLKYKPNFRRIHNALLRQGVDTAALYRKLGIREREFSSDSVGVSMARYLEVLRRAAEENNRPFLGLEIALSSTIADLGALGYMLRNAPNLEHCLALVDSYLDLVSPGAQTNLIKLEHTCIWTYQVQGFSPAQCRQEAEMTLMQFVSLVRELFSLKDWRPQEVFFQHDAPEDVTPLRLALADKLTFNHYQNGVVFPIEFLYLTVSDADPQLLNVLEQQVQRSINQLKQGANLLGRIHFLISSWLGKTEISAEKLATHLGMSRRTLHRRLREQGTSLNEQREIVILQIAKETLCTTSVSITELAQQLGYSDASAFNHAFRRLTGLSPREYRHQYSA